MAQHGSHTSRPRPSLAALGVAGRIGIAAALGGALWLMILWALKA